MNLLKTAQKTLTQKTFNNLDPRQMKNLQSFYDRMAVENYEKNVINCSSRTNPHLLHQTR